MIKLHINSANVHDITSIEQKVDNTLIIAVYPCQIAFSL